MISGCKAFYYEAPFTNVIHLHVRVHVPSKYCSSTLEVHMACTARVLLSTIPVSFSTVEVPLQYLRSTYGVYRTGTSKYHTGII